MNKLIVIVLIFGSIILFYSRMEYKEKLDVLANSTTITPIASAVHSNQEPFSNENIFVYYEDAWTIIVMVKGSKNNSDKYIGYRLVHSKKELNKEESASNYDVWSINGANEYTRVDKDSFTKTKSIVSEGEWEMAIKEEGSNDFIGGTQHGDEVLLEVSMYFDGEQHEIGNLVKQEVKELKLTSTTELYRDNTITEKSELIGQHLKTYIFTNEGLVLDQQVKFSDDMKLERSYLTMLPILRKSNGDTGEQITDTVQTDYDKKVYSVPEKDFSIPELLFVPTKKAVISGKDSGISAEVEVVEKEPSTIQTEFMLSNVVNYNKFYFAFVGDGYEVQNGDVWNQTTRYKIDTVN